MKISPKNSKTKRPENSPKETKARTITVKYQTTTPEGEWKGTAAKSLLQLLEDKNRLLELEKKADLATLAMFTATGLREEAERELEAATMREHQTNKAFKAAKAEFITAKLGTMTAAEIVKHGFKFKLKPEAKGT